MKRFSKGLFSFAGACLIIGLVMCVIGFALGGRAQNMSLWRNGPEFFHFNYDSIAFWGHGSHGGAAGAGRTEALSSAQAADVSALDIDVDACSVQLQEGDAFTVAASADGAGVPEYHWGTDGGTFYLRTDDANASLWKDVTFTITVPRGTVFRTVRLSTCLLYTSPSPRDRG